MKPITKTDITRYIEKHLPEFHQKRLTSLSRLKLKKVLARKNPYLFRAKNVLTANDLVKSLLDAHLSSQEETIFGAFLEGLAIYICHHVFGGNKSSAEGIDLEFSRDGIQYIVSIKSGPNWGNSSQIGKMKLNFSKAKRILNTNRSTTNIVAVNGCCYGRNAAEDQDGYVKKCGQRFWSFISGDNSLYTQIIEPMGHRAKERNEEFLANYAKVLNRFTVEFAKDFCTKDFAVDWTKLVKFNSSR